MSHPKTIKNFQISASHVAIILCAVVVLVSCTTFTFLRWKYSIGLSWHARAGWIAEDYFADPQLLELCDAIERNDLAQMERAIVEGANVDAVGKSGMTPLLWSFPGNRLEPFKFLLQHGADPNRFHNSDFGIGEHVFHFVHSFAPMSQRRCHAGQSIVHLASGAPKIEYLELVMAHGGDPNIVDKSNGATPLSIVLDRYISDTNRRVELLLANGANPNHVSEYNKVYPAMQAIDNDDFESAITLLNAGANPALRERDGPRKLVHFVARQERRLPLFRDKLAKDFRSLVALLEERGESMSRARAEEKRWAKLYKAAMTPKLLAETRKQIMAEVTNGVPGNEMTE